MTGRCWICGRSILWGALATPAEIARNVCPDPRPGVGRSPEGLALELRRALEGTLDVAGDLRARAWLARPRGDQTRRSLSTNGGGSSPRVCTTS